MNILITGATGFIGRHLAKPLLSEGKHTLFCLVRNLEKARFLKDRGARLLQGDITDKESLEKVKAFKIDLAFHCAGYVENKNPALLHKTNVVGTENFCRLCLDLKVKRLVYLSSVAVVSGNEKIPLVEDLPYLATNIYGISKIRAEQKVVRYRDRGLPVVILRPPMIYGEDEPHLFKFMLRLSRWRLLLLPDKGKYKMHMAYVENVVAAMLFSLDKEEMLKSSFFAADNEVLSHKQLFTLVSGAIGAKPPLSISDGLQSLLVRLPGVGKRLKFFLKDRVYSIEKIKSLGFNPPCPARESLIKSARELYYGNREK